ncbi:hypothetical protein PPL_03439 [Heterostelium album PN500]|uniref:Uncharacterized protein n=1 Tax=Heterostelium pallidum (strain ATCC 26659 / Pp 5 / PN500) TaxID=670386 RepID=D3B4W3_HETP5|nr:hypothetical protein PPL_03439 [Heterostelium album PN500]EFA84361.1 hypothetical protein PPL_03439 [Heterostelium album PN500]|eukprot:XP_020436476.1 hypothetical protein PPL_03439 [Heterostelium album PN500]
MTRQYERITLNNGQPMTRKQLYLKSIELDPTDSDSYYNLGRICESIILNNGQSMTKQQLYLKAIELDPTNSTLYKNLAMMDTKV